MRAARRVVGSATGAVAHSGRGRAYRSDKYCSLRSSAGWELKAQRPEAISGWVRVTISLGATKRRSNGDERRRQHQCCAATAFPSGTPRRRKASSTRLRCSMTIGLREDMERFQEAIEKPGETLR